MASDLLGAAGGLLGAAGAATDPAKSTMNKFKDFIQKGIPIKWMGLFILAGGIPFPPFSQLGLGGVNLLVTAPIWCFGLKTAFNAGLAMINSLIQSYFPDLWWLGWLMALNPWYLFDLIQMFSPAFNYEGYKLPFTVFNPNKPLHSKPAPYPAEDTTQYTYAEGRVGPVAILTMGLLLTAGSYSLLNMFPPSIQAAWKPLMNTTFAIIGGVTAVAGGGVGGMLALPALMKSLKEGSSQVSALVPPAASAPAPAAPAVQKGGGEISLLQVANNILEGKNTNQSGGGSGKKETEDMSTNIFLGALTLVTVGGMSLALIRSKADSTR